MSTQPPPNFTGQPRTVLAQHEHYRDAQADVDTLVERGFSITRLRIVGTDLYLVETAAGRLGTARAAARGAAAGSALGLALGALLTLLTAADPLAIPIGAALGALFGAAGHPMLRGRREHPCTGRLAAARHLLLVDTAWADDARLLLLRSPQPTGTPAPAGRDGGPRSLAASTGYPPSARQTRPPRPSDRAPPPAVKPSGGQSRARHPSNQKGKLP